MSGKLYFFILYSIFLFAKDDIIGVVDASSSSSHTKKIISILPKSVKKEIISIEKLYGYDAIYQLYKKGIYFSVHAYSGTNPFYNGKYDNQCFKIDKLVKKDPKIIVFKASGNLRRVINSKYKSLNSFSNAKNVITVTSYNKNNLYNIGPTKSNRLKPDISFKYNDQGSSYATAYIAKYSLLLAKRYKKRYKKDITIDTLKAILINSGKPLYDVRYGYSYLDENLSLKMLENFSKNKIFIYKNFIKNNSKKVMYLDLKKDSYVKLTLSYIDDLKYQKDAIINNISFFIIDENKNIYFPYSLAKDFKKRDDIENVTDNTKFFYKYLKKGRYKIVLSARLKTKQQSFTLVSDFKLEEE